MVCFVSATSGEFTITELLTPVVTRLKSLRPRVAPTGSRRHRLLQALLARMRGRRAHPPRWLPPRVTLLLLVDAADLDAATATIASVREQTNGRWELLLVGDRGETIRAAAPADRRMRVAVGSGDAASRLTAAAAVARGAFVGIVGAGDEVLPDAVRECIRATSGEQVDVIYGDETDAAKPDWSPELLLAFPYTGRLCLFRRDVVASLGGWRAEMLAAEDYRLVLAAGRLGYRVRRMNARVYRRQVPARVALTMEVAIAARRAALEEHFAAAGADATVVPDAGPAGLRIRRATRGRPLVSIVIATRDRLALLQQCIASIETQSTYQPIEIVIVDNDSAEPQTLEYFVRSSHRVVQSPGLFNFSRINNDGAKAATGEYVVFLNNDTEVISPEWIDEMLQYAQRPDVACVGAKLLFGDGRVQHAGVVLHDGSAFHVAYGARVSEVNWPDTELVRNYSAVTAACLMINRQRFLDAGGFDETFPVNYNDVELCVRLVRRGFRHVYTPYAALYHHESSSRPPGVTAAEGRHLRAVCGELLWADPFCPRPEIRGTRRWTLDTTAGYSFARFARGSARGWRAIRGAPWRPRPLLGITPTSSQPEGDAIRWMDRVEINEQARPALFMHPPARRTFRLESPSDGRFHAWVALLPDAWDQNHGGVRFRVSIAIDGRTVRSRERRVNPRRVRRHRGWVPIAVRFRTAPGRPIDLTLETVIPSGAGSQFAWAVWGEPTVAEHRSTRLIVSRQITLARDLGLRGAAHRYVRMLRGSPAHHFGLYDAWFRQQARASGRTPEDLRAELRALSYRPVISILTPVYNTPPELLRRMVQSVRDQLYPHWQLCLADDASTRPETRAALEALAGVDTRIGIVRLAVNGGISAATNAALDAAEGEFVALLDHDDEITPDALLEVAKAIDRGPDADVIYTDEDKLEFDGTHVEPFFKPDWSPEYLRSTMYLGHLVVYRRRVVEEAGRFRTAFDGSQDYDLALRVSEITGRVQHVPRVLYHWRKIEGSAAATADAKPWGLQAARRALVDHVARLPLRATVEDQPGDGYWRVRYEIVGRPLVSVIIPTDGRVARMASGSRDLPLACVQSIVERTDYENYEIVLVDNGRVSPELARYIDAQPRIRRVGYDADGPFNFAHKLNFAARQAAGEHLLLLNDDTEAITPEWMRAMLEFSQQPEIGAVGAKLLYPDGRLQHVGVVLGIGGGACHVFSGQARNSPGYFGSAWVIRNYSAVTGACCMTRRDVFDALGGFDERFATDFNDVDYCLRVRARGLRIVGTPFAQLYHFEGATFGSREHVVNPAEVSALSERWAEVIAHDPYYNPNLTRTALDYSLRL
jgi:GT2 family glycosyltransferase